MHAKKAQKRRCCALPTYHLLLLIVLYNSLCSADPIISLFFKPLSLLEETGKAEEFISRWSEPGKLEKHRLRFAAERAIAGQQIVGIPCLYAGFIAFSDNSGHVLFPRLQALSEIYVLITQRIEPVMMTGSIVHHFRVPNATPMELYHLTQPNTPRTESTTLTAWHVKRVNPETVLGDHYKIPDNTIIIIAQPKNIIYPEGSITTTQSPHLLLPDLFVRKTVNTIRNALYIVDFKNFFRHIHPHMKLAKQRKLTVLPPTQ